LAHIFGSNAVQAKVINTNAVTTVEEGCRWCCYGDWASVARVAEAVDGDDLAGMNECFAAAAEDDRVAGGRRSVALTCVAHRDNFNQ
jgi:hypothetical protein